MIEIALMGLCAVFAGGLWALWARMGQLGARLDGRIDGLEERVNQRINDLSERVNGLSERVNGLSERVARVEGMLTAVLPAPEPSPH